MKPRGAGPKSRWDKSRTPVRGQPQHSKHQSPKTPGRTPPRRTPPEESPPQDVPEPLDAGPILEELLDRVMIECAQRVLARQRAPFTVSRARDGILFVAEWRFLVRDDGDPDPGEDTDPERDGIWREDEEPQTCPWDTWAQGAVTVLDVSLPSEQVPSEDLPATTEAGGPPVCPGEVSDAVPVLGAPLPPGQVPGEKPPCQDPSAAAEASPAQVPGPEPPIAAGPRRKDPRLARPRQPRRAPHWLLAPLPAVPSKPPAQGPPGSRGATAEAGGQVPPTVPPSRGSLVLIQRRRPSRATGVPISGVPRLGARRNAARWVTPEVKVVDVTAEPERARFHWRGQGTKLRPSGIWRAVVRSLQVLPGIARPRRIEPQLCDPWLASARLAPGVTVRWGDSERRRPGTAGRDRQEGGAQKEDEVARKAETARKAEPEMKPILPYPESRLLEYGN